MVLTDLGLPRKASTKDLPIGGGAGFTAHLADDLMTNHALPAPRAAHLVDLYGGNAATVAAFCATLPDTPLPGTALTEREVLWFISHEQARHLADILQRRSPLAIRGELSLPLITATARVIARELGWDDARTQAEITRFLTEIATYHGVHLSPPHGENP